MTSGIKFTIVTPSLNQRQYIEHTIRSVIEQQGEFEIEYFIMDGGSSDGSVALISHYAELVNSGTFPIRCTQVKLYWCSQKDSGQSNAINKGLGQAKGTYAGYVNSDDLYLPGAFAKVAAAFDANPTADFIYGDGEVIDECGKLQWEWLARPYDHNTMTSYHYLWNDFTNYIMQQSTFWRTTVHERIGLFDESFHFSMDVEYWVRAGAGGLTLTHVPEKLAQFRLIDGTKSKSGPLVFWADMLEVYRRYRGYDDLDRFLAYYYLNFAKNNNWNLLDASTEERRLMCRWNELSPNEVSIIERQRHRGYGLACYLVANALCSQRDRRGTWRYLREGLSLLPTAAVRVIGFYPLLKYAIGESGSQWLDKCTDYLINVYRRKTIDYRYHQGKG